MQFLRGVSRRPGLAAWRWALAFALLLQVPVALPAAATACPGSVVCMTACGCCPLSITAADGCSSEAPEVSLTSDDSLDLPDLAAGLGGPSLDHRAPAPASHYAHPDSRLCRYLLFASLLI